MKSFLAWLVDVLSGPACPHCGHPCRGHRTLADHIETRHPETLHHAAAE